jgi:hypothetical protein
VAAIMTDYFEARSKKGGRGMAQRSRDLIEAMRDIAEAALTSCAAGQEDFLDDPMRRVDSENPERAYRRGYQQGAHAVCEGLRAAGVLDADTLRQVDRFIGTVGLWRYGPRALKRELHRDRAPTLTLTAAAFREGRAKK